MTKRQILDSCKLKDFADDNLKFEENGRKLFKPVENTVGKGEIARYEQFLLFPQCFQKACFPGASKGVIVWEWVLSVNFCKVVILTGKIKVESEMTKIVQSRPINRVNNLHDCNKAMPNLTSLPVNLPKAV